MGCRGLLAGRFGVRGFGRLRNGMCHGLDRRSAVVAGFRNTLDRCVEWCDAVRIKLSLGLMAWNR